MDGHDVLLYVLGDTLMLFFTVVAIIHFCGDRAVCDMP